MNPSSSEIEQGVRGAYAAGENPSVIGRRYGISADAVEQIADGAPVVTERGLQRRGNRIALSVVIGFVVGAFAGSLAARGSRRPQCSSRARSPRTRSSAATE